MSFTMFSRRFWTVIITVQLATQASPERCVSLYSYALQMDSECLNSTVCCGNTIYSYCCKNRDKDLLSQIPVLSYASLYQNGQNETVSMTTTPIPTTEPPIYVPVTKSRISLIMIALAVLLLFICFFLMRFCLCFKKFQPPTTLGARRMAMRHNHDSVSVAVASAGSFNMSTRNDSNMTQDPPSYEHPPPYPGLPEKSEGK